MNSIRKWFYRPKKTDSSHLAQFFFADEELNQVATELDSFDGRKDPERCTILVNKLRSCQDKVLVVIQKIIEEAVGPFKANRDFRVKFPDDVLQENLAGQLWFGAECLAAGSSIMNREIESASMRPLARALTKNLDSLRTLLREQCLRNLTSFTERIREALIIFDKLFAEFELSYVSTMVPVKSMKEYDLTQEITVLFSETVQRAMKLKLISTDMIDNYDPALMFTIPRLAIICGLLMYPEGPLNPDLEPSNISEMFRPFQTLLLKIRELLYTLSEKELSALEKALCSSDEPQLSVQSQSDQSSQTDPGFEDSIEPSTSNAFTELNMTLEKLDVNILKHTSGSGSPVTPVTPITPVQVSEFGDRALLSVSPEVDYSPTGTLINSMDEIESLNSSLNKSESKDSGLQSENVSTTEVMSFDPNSVIPSAETQVTSSETQPNVSAEESVSSHDSDADPESLCFKSCCRPESDSNVHFFCREIVESMMDTAVNMALSRTAEGSYSRQHSWQYNLNIEIPRISVSDLPQLNRDTSSVSSSENNVFDCDSEVKVTGSVSSSDNSTIHSDNEHDRLCSKAITENDEACHESDDMKHVLQVLHSICDENNDQRSCLSDTTGSDKSPQRDAGHSDCSCTTNLGEQATNQRSKSSKKTSDKDNTTKPPLDRIQCKTGSDVSETHETNDVLDLPRIQRLRYPDSISSSFSSFHSNNFETEWDRESGGSSETSSYNSESNDDEEIALAIQAAEFASRKEARSRFRSSSDLIHRLFVCISGVADQLQTNYAGDLRHILKCVFDMNSSEPLILPDENSKKGIGFDRHPSFSARTAQRNNRAHGYRSYSYRSREPPTWVPDKDILNCTSCEAPFTFVRRRHHCRNCGKIYCNRCSGNFVPLPHFGQLAPVRVCNRCFMFQVTPFTVSE